MRLICAAVPPSAMKVTIEIPKGYRRLPYNAERRRGDYVLLSDGDQRLTWEPVRASVGSLVGTGVTAIRRRE